MSPIGAHLGDILPQCVSELDKNSMRKSVRGALPLLAETALPVGNVVRGGYLGLLSLPCCRGLKLADESRLLTTLAPAARAAACTSHRRKRLPSCGPVPVNGQDAADGLIGCTGGSDEVDLDAARGERSLRSCPAAVEVDRSACDRSSGRRGGGLTQAASHRPGRSGEDRASVQSDCGRR